MNFRLAVMQDLPRLKAMYEDIIQNMNNNQIQIWDDIYPCEFFDEDIKNNRLYVLYSNEELISAFSMYPSPIFRLREYTTFATAAPQCSGSAFQTAS